jgi:acyl-CoA thioesterase
MRARKRSSRTPSATIRSSQLVAERVVQGMLLKDAYSKWLGLTLVDVRPRRATVRATVRPEMVNGFGVGHGGIAYSIADSALAFASNTHGKVTMSVESTITYPKSVQVGDVLTAIAKSEVETNRLGFYRVTVRNQKDEIVALMRGTVYKTKDEHRA